MPSRASARAAAKKEPAAPKLGPTEPKTADDGPTVDSRIEVQFNDRKWYGGTVLKAEWPDYEVKYDDGEQLYGRLSLKWRLAKAAPAPPPAAGKRAGKRRAEEAPAPAPAPAPAVGKRTSKRAADDDFVWDEDDYAEESEDDESDEEDYDELAKLKLQASLAKSEARAKKEAAAQVAKEAAAQAVAQKENGGNQAVPIAVDDDDEAGGSQLTQAQQAKREEDGFVMVPVEPATEPETWGALEQLLATDPKQLGSRCRDSAGGNYDGLRLANAWVIDNPSLDEMYEGGCKKVARELDRLAKKGKRACFDPAPGLYSVKTASAAARLPQPLRDDVNEQILLHGTQPGDGLFSMLSGGANERFSGTNAGTAFGDGFYMAEDVGKCDQYVEVDVKLDPTSELHQRLYDVSNRHQGSVHYVLVCRAALGAPIRTKATGKDATAIDGGGKVFPSTFRELAPVDGIPGLFHHSLVAELGETTARFREFICFHSQEYVRPQYLIAYQRTSRGAVLGRPSPAARKAQARFAVPPPPVPTYQPAAASYPTASLFGAGGASSSTAAPPLPAAPPPPPAAPPPKPSKKNKKQKKAKAAAQPKDYSYLKRAAHLGGGFYLPNVPRGFHGPDSAVAFAGAHYDSVAYSRDKQWFAPRWVDLRQFAAWMPRGAVEQLNGDLDDIVGRLKRPAGGTWLNVPFLQKDDAKARGATCDYNAGTRDDGIKKHVAWFVPEGEADFTRFQQWLPQGAAAKLTATAQAGKAARLAQAQAAAQAQAQAQAAAAAQAQAQAQAAAQAQAQAAAAAAAAQAQAQQAALAAQAAQFAAHAQAPPAPYAPPPAPYAPPPAPQQPPANVLQVGTWLNCPFAEKDDARALGAKWAPFAGLQGPDAQVKKWFVPAGMDPTPFRRWI